MHDRRVATFLSTTLAVCCLFALAMPQPATAQEKSQTNQAVSYRIGAGTLESALNKFATQSKLQVVYSPELVAGKNSSGISGQYSPQQALSLLVENKGIAWKAVNQSMYVLSHAKGEDKRPIQKKSPPGASSENGKSLNESGSPAESIQDLEKMVVVGSRLGVSPYDVMSSAVVISKQEIERSGASNIAQVLSYLPEVSINNSGDSTTGTVGGSLAGREVGVSTVQLRGLPQGTTLVLINGRRSGVSASSYSTPFFDLSTIPLSMVERIEVLPMGSSAVYGGDGLAGVVNIVLKRDADSLEMNARHLAASGYEENIAGITFGKSWSRARLMASATWRSNTVLDSDERDITSNDDFRRFGGTDRRSAVSNPGNVYSMAGCPARTASGYSCFVPIGSRGNLPGLNSPFSTIPTGQDGSDLVLSDFTSSAGTLNLQTNQYQLISGSSQLGFGLNASFDLSSSSEAFTEWNYTSRKVDAKQMVLTLGSGLGGFNSSLIPANNPFNPFGVDVGVNYRFDNTGIFQEYSQEYWRGLVGIRKTGDRVGMEATAWQSRERSDTGGVGSWNSDAIVARLQSTNPADALNVFVGDGTAPASRDVLMSMINQVGDSFGVTVQGVNAFITGSASIPSGRATGLIGFEYERTVLDQNPWTIAVASVSGKDERKAVFGELKVPLVGHASKPWDRLVMTGAARYESTGRAQENAFTNSIGLGYRPIESLSIRANYGTAFKPINLSSASMDPRIQNSSVADPRFPGQFPVVPVIISGGVSAGLEPEKSSSTSLSVVYDPAPDVRFSLSHWETKLRDRLYFLGIGTIVANEADYPTRVTRDPVTGAITLVDARQVNISATDISGVDVRADMRFVTSHGEITSSLAAAYTYKYDEQRTPTSAVLNNLATRSTTGWAPRWKIVPRVGWYWNDQSGLTLTGRYVSKYTDPTALQTWPRVGQLQTLGKFWQFDLNMDTDISKWIKVASSRDKQVRLNLGIVNLFDRLPDYCNSCAASGSIGYDPNQYDIVGRRVYMELKLGF